MIRAALSLHPAGRAALAAWGFVTSRLGLVLIAYSLAFGAGWYVRAGRCDAAAVRAELAAARADLTVAQNAETLARSQSAALEVSNAANQDKVDALARDLKTRKGRACGLSDDDARRLRDIR